MLYLEGRDVKEGVKQALVPATVVPPQESVWSHLKRSLANLAKRDISQLIALVKTRLRRMQYRPGRGNVIITAARADIAVPQVALPRLLR